MPARPPSRAAARRGRVAGTHRGRTGLVVGLLAALLAALPTLAACTGTAPAASDSPRVVASTDVWGSVARAVAGPGVDVRSIVSDPAADPHSYEGTPADVAALTAADVVVVNGGGYDTFAERAATADPAVAGKAVEAFALRADPRDANEHVWFDPAAVKGVAARVADHLAAVEPAQAAALHERAAAFAARVDGEAAALAAVGRARPGARVMSTEPVAHYLLATAGVTDVTPPAFVAAVENGNDPPAATLAAASGVLDARAVAALVDDPQTATPITQLLRERAAEAGIGVVTVTETLPAGQDYLSWLDGTRAALARALGARP